MTRHDKTRPDERLETVEDDLAKAAQSSEADFYKRTAKAAAGLDEAEAHLENEAQKAESSFYEKTAKPEARLEETERQLEQAARRANDRSQGQ